MTTKVTMNLSDDELALINNLKSSLNLSTNTGTIVQSLRISKLVVDALVSHKQIAFLDNFGRTESTLIIPGLVAQ